MSTPEITFSGYFEPYYQRTSQMEIGTNSEFLEAEGFELPSLRAAIQMGTYLGVVELNVTIRENH
jgi:hypothetical protein